MTTRSPATPSPTAGPVLSGIHHVTAVTADAQSNIDFYAGVLGLRLVKLTVNFDDPRSFHLYYGDERGSPGTVLTFFEWPGIPRGRVGPPQVTATAFAVPAGSLDDWAARLREHQVEVGPPVERLGERVLQFADPDGMPLEIVGVEAPAGEPWAAGPVPVAHAIRGFHSVTLSEEGYERTADTLTSLMGFAPAGEEGNRFRYRAGAPNAPVLAPTIDLLCAPDARHGQMGAGIVHHVAFRTPDAAQHAQWRERIAARGLNVSPVMDRTYFHSIYYREPGGVLFEIATDAPGFTADEPLETLGQSLTLPPQHERFRPQIQARWAHLRLPAQSGTGRR
ncbi:MAG TPA: ring-cleaving dioxygenase [Phycisphaerales bacterium]|nr:ring-cleaving dioxygenase [Phycisphaerales bacterium]